MAINLVSLIMQFLTPDVIARITSARVVDRNNTQTAIVEVLKPTIDALKASSQHFRPDPRKPMINRRRAVRGNAARTSVRKTNGR
jgi:hypothetical protein